MRKLREIIFNYKEHVLAGFLFLFVLFCITALSLRYKGCIKTIEKQKTEIDSLKRYNKQLAEINGLNVEVVFNFTQKNTLAFSVNNCQNVAKEIAYLTRGALLDSLKKK